MKRQLLATSVVLSLALGASLAFANTSYQFRTPFNKVIEEEMGISTEPETPQGSVPEAPYADSILSSNSSLTVNFTPPGNDGGSIILNYTLTCGHISTIGNDSPLTVNGLNNGSNYNCSVIATNEIGNSDASNLLSAIPLGELLAPVFQSTTVGDKEAFVYFAQGANDGHFINHYNFNCDNNISTTTTSSPLHFTGLTNGTNYSCNITKDTNSGESPASDGFSFTPLGAPDAPINLTAEAGDSQLTFTFDSPFNNGGSEITGYEMDCGDSSQSEPSSPITVTGLQNGTSYDCSVRAENAHGFSEFSSAVSASPISSFPANAYFDYTSSLGGIVGYWRFDETSGQDIHDSVGSNTGWMNATQLAYINAPSLLVEDSNPSYRFGNNNRGATLTKMESDSWDKKSISAIIKPESFSSTQVIFREGSTVNGWGLSFINSTQSLRLAVLQNGTFRLIDYPVSNLSTNNTYHIVGSVDSSGNSMKLYVDGVLVGTNTSTISSHNGSCEAAVGGSYCAVNGTFRNPANAGQSANNFNGYIDEVALFNRVLLDSEISNMSNLSKGILP